MLTCPQRRIPEGSVLSWAAAQDRLLRGDDSEREHAMSKPAVSALAPLPFDLVYSDGEPLDSEWHTE
jgi:hypothetical protein